jgi:hypothetical protein
MQKVLFITMMFLSILSCKKKIEDSSKDTALTGSWNFKSGCKSITGGYAKENYVFTDVDVTQTVSVYSDSNCSAPLISVIITGQYQVSNLVSDFFKDKWDLDSTLGTYSIELKSSSIVTSYNTASYCGYNNWTINTKKNVAGLNCGGTVMPSAGVVEYGFVVFVKQFESGGPFTSTYPGDMYFGSGDSTHDGTSLEQRFNVHNLTYIYVE